MTRTAPLRLITLQLRQIFLTDAITFIVHLVARFDQFSAVDRKSLRHFALKTILARDRSYGVSSTVTLSPGRIRM